MSDRRLTEDELKAIRTRVETTTPGTWEWKEWERTLFLTVGGDLHRIVGIEDYILSKQGDREFIAHARTDIPALLAHIEELMKDLNFGFEDVTGS